MAGGIRKPRQLADFRPDFRGAAFIAKTRSLRDDVLLRGVAAELEHDGIMVVESTLFLGDLVPAAGTLTRKAPRTREWEDVRFGVQVARDIGRWEIGQSVVVKRRTVLAVEGMEGTDLAIRRGGELGRGGVVVVKVSKPGQDLRFDVPAVGHDHDRGDARGRRARAGARSRPHHHDRSRGSCTGGRCRGHRGRGRRVE